jgi:hypothetical protein
MVPVCVCQVVYFHLAISYNSKQTYQLYTKIYGECKYPRSICFSGNSGDQKLGLLQLRRQFSNVGHAACVHCNAYSRASGTPHWQNNILLVYSPWSSLRDASTLYHVNIKNKNILQLRTSLLNEKSQIRRALSSEVTVIGLSR